MDPLRLLTRSIKSVKKTSGGQATPSAGPANNPQLFHDQAQGNRKRKRGSGGPSAGSKVVANLDFFGGGASEQQQEGHAESTAPHVEAGPDDEAQLDGSAMTEHIPLSREAQREVLASHKVKVTLLGHAQPRVAADERSEKSEKSKKSRKSNDSKASDDTSSSKSRTRLYPTPVADFRELGGSKQPHLSRTLARNITDQGYSTTTEVQLAALPLLLAPAAVALGSQPSSDAEADHDPVSIDLLTVAPTGSGKTLAFMIPVIQALIQHRHDQKKAEGADSTMPASRAVILAPTKELASQIVNEGRKLALNTGVRITNIRKGMRLTQPGPYESVDQDNQAPLVKADIVVSTPLALLNTFGHGADDINELVHVRYLVLDEADVLLDPLFREQTLRVWNALTNPALRVSFWSATMGSSIEELVKATMDARKRALSHTDATSVVEAPLVRLVVGLKDSAVPNIDHRLIYAATEQGKLMALRQLLHPAPETVNSQPVLRAPFLVFTQTIERAVALHSELQYDIPPEAGGISRIAVLHSDLSETARDHVMTRFRKGEVWILITTDLLSRGVDFRGVNGVVNYDVPSSAAAYVHRVGRTGRAGREGGVAFTYYTDDDVASIKTVANLIAASQKARGSTGGPNQVQQWLLDALPTPSKRDKQNLKKRGVESRRSTAAKDSKTSGAAKTRISTKSGYIRKLENNKRDAIAARQKREQDADSGSEQSFGGFDD